MEAEAGRNIFRKERTMNEVQFSADDVARMLQINHLAVHQLSEKGVLKVVRSSNGTEYYRAEDLYHFVMEHVFLGPNLRVHGDNILDDQVLRFIILGEHYQMLVSVCFWCTAKGKKSEVVKLLYALLMNGLRLSRLFSFVVRPVFRRIRALYRAKKISRPEKQLAYITLHSAVILFLEVISSTAARAENVPLLQSKIRKLIHTGQLLWYTAL
jgi:hypothetical protein